MKPRDNSKTGKCLVPCFQGCASVVCFTSLYSLSSLTTSTLSVYISSQITTLEKQFGFSSSQSGILLSCNDIGFLAFTLFISYRASTAHIPRALATSTILFGLAGILCSCAYFLNPNYKLKLTTTNESTTHIENDTSHLKVCNRNGNNATADFCDDDKRSEIVGNSTSFTPVAMAIIAIGMILQGVGKAPRTPFSSYYIDENVDKRKTSLYLGKNCNISRCRYYLIKVRPSTCSMQSLEVGSKNITFYFFLISQSDFSFQDCEIILFKRKL